MTPADQLDELRAGDAPAPRAHELEEEAEMASGVISGPSEELADWTESELRGAWGDR